MIGGAHDDPGQDARIGTHHLELIQPDQRRGRVDGLHHIVQGSGELEDVLPIERGDEGAVESLDDPVGHRVARVLDRLDLVGLVPQRLVRREHLLEQGRAAADLRAERDEVLEEPFFLRQESAKQSHHGRETTGWIMAWPKRAVMKLS